MLWPVSNHKTNMKCT